MERMVTIDSDMLGIIGFLSTRVNGHVIFSSSGCWWLRDVFEQVPHDEVSAHLVSLALDNITHDRRMLFYAYVAKDAELNREGERYFRDIGFIYGADSSIPATLKQRCEFLYHALSFSEEG